MLDVVRRDPRTLGVAQTRWRLRDVLEQCRWLRLRTPSGMTRLLRRLGIARKRGRAHVHSPDPDYVAKCEQAQARQQAAREASQVATRARHPRREVTLLLDELTYYRAPTLASAYEQVGHDAQGHSIQPLAELAHAANTPTRVGALLDVVSGHVIWRQAARVGVSALVALYQDVRAAYPEAARIWVIQDNWPVHWHPDLLVALEPQETPWTPRRPASWASEASPTARGRWGALHLPIQCVFLPTYASWLNPIEKLWRWLKQDVLHLHRYTTDLPWLREQVAAFLNRFTNGSMDATSLLRYVGLLLPK